MMAARFGRHSLTICVFVLGVAAFTVPAFAQGQVRGKVVGADNKPIEGAAITIEMTEGRGKFQTKSDRRGEYRHIGLPLGNYKITASKDGMTQSFEQRIGFESEVNFVLKPGSQADMSEDERKKAEARMAAVRSAFDEGVALSNAGKYDEAIEKFNAVLAEAPKCAECYLNIGTVHMLKKEYDQAEAAFKQSLEIRPDQADAYNALANLYNAQKKFNEAAEASAQAQKLGAAAGASGASASTAFNQGVIYWNAQKVAEARKQFEEAVRLDPTMADAHYWLGMATVNEGKLEEAVPHFETYLKLAPDGQYAEPAKNMLAAIKK